MTSPILPKENQEDQNTIQHKKSKTTCNNNKCYRHALKIKTKCCRYKCDKALRKKLHRYRLRPNGEEDPEVIDVSHIFLSSLKIKSPTKLLKSLDKYDFEEVRPKNYLFNMARRKLKLKSKSESVVDESKSNKTTKVSQLQNGKITSYTQNKSPISKTGRIYENTKEMPGSIEKSNEVTAVSESNEKKQTNAFKLLMDSRNKSIGSNSPGKEKQIDPSEMEEIIEKKITKAKRNLALQKMAEAKGALENREREEQQEKSIQRNMEKRAERLKKMISNTKPKASKLEWKNTEKTHIMEKEVEHEVEEVVHVIDEDSSDKNTNPTKKLRNNTTKKAKTLHLVDIFKEVVQPKPNTSPDIKLIRKEDEEFLKKLSPSIKKKENMLCYFRKVEKKCESPVEPENNEEQSPVIKIKVSLKSKKKMKKRKLSLNKDATTEVLKDHNENSSNKNDKKTPDILDLSRNTETDEKISKERKKRKRNENLEEIATPETVVTADPIKTEKGRFKRNVKRPIKYVNDVDLSSSDEELHIFTPRKRRYFENKNESTSNEPSDEDTKKETPKSRKKTQKDEKAEKKPAKLAPIFVPKPLLNPEQLEAKQKFLYSGVPDKIKKMINQQKNSSIEVSNEFQLVVHVQQILEDALETSNIPLPTLAEDNLCEDILSDIDESLLKRLVAPPYIETIVNTVPIQNNFSTAILQNIKELYPKFPVYRTYRTLKSQSRGEFREVNTPDLDNSRELMNGITDILSENPEYLNWTDKYKATSSKHLIGNFEGVKEMKKWLTTWTDNQAKPKAAINDSDSSDFCYDSDSNSRDCVKNMNNLLILTGPPGCGKTSSVYAVAAELAIKVIEVNASSKRTGKMMLQDLQEATQSHKVNRAGLENVQKIQEIEEVPVLKTHKKRGRPKKLEVSLKRKNRKGEISSQSSHPSQPVNSQESVRTAMSLILVDDADIVFDQDDGFSSAIAQLIQSSKRPVILVTGSLSCPHLQRFLQCGKIINMNLLLPRMLGTWLDLMCLADKGTCWPGLGAKFLDYFRGDIRKSINCLQFHTTAYLKDNLQDEATSQSSNYKCSPDDEGSNISWPESEGMDDKNTVQNFVKDDVWKYFMDKQIKLRHVAYPQNLLNVWWSIPTMIGNAFEYKPQIEVKPKTNRSNPQKNFQELDAIANLIDTFSISDLISNSNPDTTGNIASMPWYSPETDSVSELESLHGYYKSHEVTNDILQSLVTSSVEQAQITLQCERDTTIQFPSMTAQRSRDRIVHRHEYISDMLNPSAALDRRALSLDYWSTCRSICRIEKNKTDVILKRNNRFCHYLKSMNAMARNETFDSLGDCLFAAGEPLT